LARTIPTTPASSITTSSPQPRIQSGSKNQDLLTERQCCTPPDPLLATQGDPLELRADLDPVLLDMRNSGAIVPDVLAEAHEWA
jgi:hypothetical protein